MTSRCRNALRILLCVAFTVLFAPARSGAQTAPAGNAHPPTQNLSQGAEALVNPFGEHSTDAAAVSPPQQKAAFASGLELEPLRSLAVFHNGRIKVLDTLGREMVSKMTGKREYNDLVPGGPVVGSAATPATRKVDYDPLFTLLDMMIDPVYYLDKPILGVDFLPLRRALLELQYPGDETEQKRQLKSGRVTPIAVDRFATQVSRAHMDEPAMLTALSRLDQSARLFLEGHANLVMVAPADRADPWRHLSALPADAPVRLAAAEFGAAWRAGDAGRVNGAAVALARELPLINPGVYPGSRRALEMTYNRANAFEYGLWAYCLSLLGLLLAFGTGRRWLAILGTALLIGALSLHGFGFVLRCIIAERFAIQNQFESMTGVSLFAVLVATAIMLVRRQWLFGAAGAAVGFMVLITATQAKIPGVYIEREAAILNTSVLLKYHVTTVLVSYGLISLGLVVSLFYLGTHYFGATREGSAMLAGAAVDLGSRAAPGGVSMGDDSLHTATRARTLADLDTAQLIVLQLAFWTLGVGILLGAWWADHSWGRWWAFDPKETWALLTWIIYLIVVHVRIASPRNKALATAWLSVVGFIVMLWTYFGVNLLLPGLHAYA